MPTVDENDPEGTPGSGGRGDGERAAADPESQVDKFDRLAGTFSERDYADPDRYQAWRARRIAALEPRSRPGDTILDLGCGDGNMAAPLSALGLRYRGVDSSPGMIEAARTRNPGIPFELARLESYTPPEPVECVLCLRSLKYVADRPAFFAHVRSYARGKFVFDIDLRLLPAPTLERELAAAGFGGVGFRPFFFPQLRRVPVAFHPAIRGLERSGPLARLVSRRRGIFLCAAVI